MTLDARAAAAILARVRARRPLVHNMSNLVALELTTNALLAVGAAPAAVLGLEEVEEFLPRAAALVVNLGTLTAEREQALTRAATAASERFVPWVLDPVGAGATRHRTRAAQALLRLRPSVLRANAGEVAVLSGHDQGATHGVDAAISTDDIRDRAARLAAAIGCVVAMTGARDHVSDGSATTALDNGDAMMTRVTGIGCAASALVAAALAVERDARRAAAAALLWLGVAGEIAADASAGPGSFAVHLLDNLHQLDEATLVARARIR
jgi:hydroxyethylthiazole kinase